MTNHDAAFLESQYNARASIPDHPEIFARWARESAAVRQQLSGHVGMAYGSDPGERLDWYPATGSGPRPILYFVHGGYWRSLDKDDFTFIVPALHQLGLDVVVVNYGLCPRVTVAEIVAQVRRGLTWTKDRASEYGADPGRIYLTGHSAGGHLVAMLMATDWDGEGRADVGTAIRGGLAISGIYELEPLCHTSINIEARLDTAEAIALSPVLKVPTVAAPLALAVGDDESDEFKRQSLALANAWPICAVPGQVPGAHHLAVVESLAMPGGTCHTILAGHLS
ncbi:MAG: alpha/beta hydrolase fold domain-containing protein [Proteobacteria bacterium]|nr:alpha/beta hydrolase fold domain-containing protein [Pseudomonadota bacterium]